VNASDIKNLSRLTNHFIGWQADWEKVRGSMNTLRGQVWYAKRNRD